MTPDERERLDIYNSLTDAEYAEMDSADFADYEALSAMAQTQPQEAPNGMQEADKAQAQAPVKRGETYTERLAQDADKLQRAAFPRLTDLGRFDAVEGLKDVASLPGRAIMGLASGVLGAEEAATTNGLAEGQSIASTIPRRVLESTARTESTSQNLIPRIISNVGRDPLTLALPVAGEAVAGASRAFPMLTQLSRPSVVAREGIQGATQGVISGFGGGNEGSFSPVNAAIGAAGVAPGATKLAVEAPAWARVRTPTGVVDDLIRNELKPTFTMRKAEGAAYSPAEMERLYFQPTEFGPPMIQGVRDWRDLSNATLERMGQIGDKSLKGLSSDEFSAIIPNEEIISAPIRAIRSADNALQIEREAMQDALRDPFTDVFTKYNAPVQPGFYQDRQSVNEAYDALARGEGTVPFTSGAEARDVVETRRALLKRAQDLGKYKQDAQALSEKAGAYDAAYNELGDVLKARVPLTEGTAPYYEAQKQFAELYPWKKAITRYVDSRAYNNQRPDQTILGRFALSDAANLARQKLIRQMPEKVTIENVEDLYRLAPRETKALESVKDKGSFGTKTGAVTRQFPNLIRSYNKSKKDEK